MSHSQTEELLDLIAEAQRQRMEDQRAPGPPVVCGSCCLDTSQDFYNMLIHYQVLHTNHIQEELDRAAVAAGMHSNSVTSYE